MNEDRRMLADVLDVLMRAAFVFCLIVLVGWAIGWLTFDITIR